MICLVLFTLVGILYVMRYARKIKKDPSKSIMYERDQEYIRTTGINEDTTLPAEDVGRNCLLGLLLILVFGRTAVELEPE